jgi:nitrate reductase NapE component
MTERELKHPMADKFYKICERYDTAYLILGDVISQDPSNAQKNLSQPEFLEEQIKKAYQLRLRKLKTRMARAALYSTISIFVTKMLVAFAIEIPFDKYVLGGFNSRALTLNVLIPPLLMFFLVLTIRPPRKENLDKVIIETIKIAYEKEKKDVYAVKPARKKGFIFSFIIIAFYSLTFLVSFGAIIWILKKLNFGILSIIIFLMFFSLITFAGVKIRERAKELKITPEHAGFLTFLMDTLSLPFLRVGRWLSDQWLKYNVVLVLITALIDMPFQVFCEFLEHWRTFLREKKEEIH